jgi:hypothetical protein
MGYIVHLNGILNDICMTILGRVSANYVQQVMDRHVRSGGLRDAIPRDISNFITANKTLVPQGDVVLEKIMDLNLAVLWPPLSHCKRLMRDGDTDVVDIFSYVGTYFSI